MSYVENNHLVDLQTAKLVLATGEVFTGLAPKWQQTETFGEVVFNTGMTGYEETLTDPSYAGQILCFTYPILGNYGVSLGANFESEKIHLQGVISQTVFSHPSHYSSTKNILAWFEQQQIPAIFALDTRELTKTIRKYGTVTGLFLFGDEATAVTADSIAKITFPNIAEKNFVAVASCSKVIKHGNGKYKIILVDCGSKRNILNNLLKFDVTVYQVPFNYDYSQDDYDGVLLSNGPGDPKQCVETIAILKQAMHNKPRKAIFGICLGSQLMALAIGANTYKLKTGHRGQNQPCIDTETKLCYLTSQNHGYAVDENTLPPDWLVTFRHLNDNSVSGIRHKTAPFSAVQFHPEAAAGPHDTHYLFNDFIAFIERNN